MIGIVVPSVLKVVSGWVVPSVVGVVSISVLLLVTSGVVVSVVVRSANSSKYIIIYQARYEVTVYRIRKFLILNITHFTLINAFQAVQFHQDFGEK